MMADVVASGPGPEYRGAQPSAPAQGRGRLEWVRVCSAAPYFETESGRPWVPIGYNDAISWPPLSDLSTTGTNAAEHLTFVKAAGVTCLRLMLEYAQDDAYLFERAVGDVNPNLVQIWDRLFALAEQHDIRVLLTPFDTFWMWQRWDAHPYNAANGGPCATPRTLLTSPAARAAIKERLAFAIDRWGGSGAFFALDLWNELHPAYAEGNAGLFHELIGDLASFVKQRQTARYGRGHPLTVSAFGPVLIEGFWSHELGPTQPDPRMIDAVFRHELLDFATVHTYAEATIDDPADTVAPAVAMGALTRTFIELVGRTRPFFDSEHGPIHTFKDKHRVLPIAFDEEYFRHIQWAHFASGGAGGGMRWPNRDPHTLTPGMYEAQSSLSKYTSLIDWQRFERRNLNADIHVTPSAFVPFGCGDQNQAVAWILRTVDFDRDGTLAKNVGTQVVQVHVPELAPGEYIVTAWHTLEGRVLDRRRVQASGPGVTIAVDVGTDLALALVRIRPDVDRT